MLETLAPVVVAYYFQHYGQIPMYIPPSRPAIMQSVPRVGNFGALQNLSVSQEPGDLAVRTSDPSIVTSIAPGSQRVPMLQLQLSASCNAPVFIDAINLRRVGLGAQSDIQSVYILSGSERLTRARSISNKDGRFTLQLRNFYVPACGSTTMDVVVDFAQNASIAGEHRMILDGPQAIDAGGTSVQILSAPVTTQIRRTSGSTRGVINVEYLSLATNRISFGSNRKVARFSLEADGRDHHRIQAIRLTNQGSAKYTDLQNLYLETNRGQRISEVVPYLDNDVAFLRISPALSLRRGQTRVLNLRADVRGSSRRTIRFEIEEPGDVIATASRRALR